VARTSSVPSQLKHPAVERVCRINQTWIVRQGLEQDAHEYLLELGQNDPDRMIRSCELVMSVQKEAYKAPHIWQVQDPKSFFYPSLFYYSKPWERQKWLKGRPFTLAVVNAMQRGRLRRWKGCHLKHEVEGKTQTRLFMVVGLIKRAVAESDAKLEETQGQLL
jgi:hypothetical protein